MLLVQELLVVALLGRKPVAGAEWDLEMALMFLLVQLQRVRGLGSARPIWVLMSLTTQVKYFRG